MNKRNAIWILGLACAVAAPAAVASEALSKSAGCVACHLPDKKLVGPTYKEIAAKYKKDPAAAPKLIEKVRKGGVGVWGKVPMVATPPAKINDADLKKLMDWILAQ